MNGICCELGARAGPSLGAEGPQVGMFTALSADGGAILEEGKTFANRACIPSPQETIPTNALRPGVQRPLVKRTQKVNELVLLRCLCLLPIKSHALPMGFYFPVLSGVLMGNTVRAQLMFSHMGQYGLTGS